MIADSNRMYISPHLDTEESDRAVMSGVFTADELHDLLDRGEHNDTLKQEIVIIMLGASDIMGSKGRREESGCQVYT